MGNIIDVATGEVKVGRKNEILVSNALGSCVAVIAIDMEQKIGGIAHVMLAGKSPANEKQKTKYAFNAINELFKKLQEIDSGEGNLKVFIAGGGNVLKLKDDTVCEANIKSTIEFLSSKGINIHKKAVGGTERRTVRLDISNRTVYCSEGNSSEEILWKEN